MVAKSHRWLLSPWNVASATENFYFHVMLLSWNLNLSSPIWLVTIWLSHIRQCRLRQKQVIESWMPGLGIWTLFSMKWGASWGFWSKFRELKWWQGEELEMVVVVTQVSHEDDLHWGSTKGEEEEMTWENDMGSAQGGPPGSGSWANSDGALSQDRKFHNANWFCRKIYQAIFGKESHL